MPQRSTHLPLLANRVGRECKKEKEKKGKEKKEKKRRAAAHSSHNLNLCVVLSSGCVYIVARIATTNVQNNRYC